MSALSVEQLPAPRDIGIYHHLADTVAMPGIEPLSFRDATVLSLVGASESATRRRSRSTEPFSDVTLFSPYSLEIHGIARRIHTFDGANSAIHHLAFGGLAHNISEGLESLTDSGLINPLSDTKLVVVPEAKLALATALSPKIEVPVVPQEEGLIPVQAIHVRLNAALDTAANTILEPWRAQPGIVFEVFRAVDRESSRRHSLEDSARAVGRELRRHGMGRTPRLRTR